MNIESEIKIKKDGVYFINTSDEWEKADYKTLCFMFSILKNEVDEIENIKIKEWNNAIDEILSLIEATRKFTWGKFATSAEQIVLQNKEIKELKVQLKKQLDIENK